MDGSEGHKGEMLKLIMEKNAQIKEMEDNLDNLAKEKEQSVPMTVIPTECSSSHRSQYNKNNHNNRNSIIHSSKSS
jgi:hypothetical protein